MVWGFYCHLPSTNCQLCALARCVLDGLRAKSRKGETKNATHFGEDVFGDEAIRTYLSKETAKKLQATIQEGKPLDPSIAGEVAHGIRQFPDGAEPRFASFCENQ